MNCIKEETRILSFIEREFKEKGFQKAVIGISGGLDSAVVATLLVKALGKDNVYGYSLPYGNQFDMEDVDLIFEMLNIQKNFINIKPIVDSFIREIKYESLDDKLGIGNLKARIRMTILYDMSAFHRALVVGTGNRTELLLGYFTLYGDGACAMEPIGHLYKTEVKELAKHLVVSKSIVNKAPSAGLWEGQTDEKELGASYEEIDNILKVITRGDNPMPEGLKDIIFETKILYLVVDRMKKNKFKSKLPTIMER